MERRLLGRTDLAITPIGLGAWAIGGGDWCLGWGPQSNEVSIATIRRAIAHGINWIDTAAVYGLGRSERIIERALRHLRPADRPSVFTSGGFAWDDLGNVARDLRPDAIRRGVEGSLRRLDVPSIALYQLDASADTPCRIPSLGGSLDEAWQTLAALQREGKVRAIGLANPQPPQIARLTGIAPVAIVQAPYSLLRREIEHDLLPYCSAHGIGVLASSPMAAGLLTGAWTPARLRLLPHNDWRRCHPSFQPREVARALELVDRLRDLGARHQGIAPGTAAIAWTLRQPAVTAAVAGARRPEQVDELVAAASVRLGVGEMEAVGPVASNWENPVP
jgi:aryl-alcohol dehydrogenase-like predicted oxidoreductase